jgi:hypothetical protein
MRTSLASPLTRIALAAVAALALLATVSAANAAARTIYFRDGLGASAKVTYNVVGQSVHFSGTLWDKKGDGYHARIYGYTNGERFGIRKAVRGQARAFKGASPVKTYFKVCTYDRNVPLRCTTKFTNK